MSSWRERGYISERGIGARGLTSNEPSEERMVFVHDQLISSFLSFEKCKKLTSTSLLSSAVPLTRPITQHENIIGTVLASLMVLKKSPW